MFHSFIFNVERLCEQVIAVYCQVSNLSAIYCSEEKLHYNEMLMISALYETKKKTITYDVGNTGHGLGQTKLWQG